MTQLFRSLNYYCEALTSILSARHISTSILS